MMSFMGKFAIHEELPSENGIHFARTGNRHLPLSRKSSEHLKPGELRSPAVKAVLSISLTASFSSI